MFVGTLLSFLIAGLGSEDFTTREYSQKVLSFLNQNGTLNEYLNAAGGKSRDPEVRMRISVLVGEYRIIKQEIPSIKKLLDKLYDVKYLYPRYDKFEDRILVEACQRFDLLMQYDNGCYTNYYHPDYVWKYAMCWYIAKRFEEGATRQEILDLLASLENREDTTPQGEEID